jgi:hypothetical protein
MAIRVGFRMAALGCVMMLAQPMLASSEAAVPSPEILLMLEQKADAAAARDQCYLYSEVLGTLTELEGKQVDAGDPKASETLAHMERIVEKMKRAEVQDAKRLKNAEVLLEHATRRLGDMLHLARGEERAAMKATLDHLNRVHDEVLALVFAR